METFNLPRQLITVGRVEHSELALASGILRLLAIHPLVLGLAGWMIHTPRTTMTGLMQQADRSMDLVG